VTPIILLLALAGDPQPPASDSVVIRSGSPHAQLDEILQQPLFNRWKLRQQRAATEPHEFHAMQVAKEMMEDMFRSIGSFLGRILRMIRFPRFPGMPGGGGFVSVLTLVMWLGGAALLLYFLVMIYRIISQRGKSVKNARVLSREEIRSALEEGDALALDGSQWLNEAQHLAQAGEVRAVYRALYLALLSGLHRTGKIEYRRQRTNWTYVSRFRGSDQDRSVFSELTKLFDEVWYGLKGIGHTDIDALRAKVTVLVGKEKADA